MEYLSLKNEFNFNFGNYSCRVLIRGELPSLREIEAFFFSGNRQSVLTVCDRNTEELARRIVENRDSPLLVLESGEQAKTWESVETILRFARATGVGRDGLFLGIGGGVIGDLTAFAASIYMRGVKLSLVSTTLLGMVDASLGGKTGIDLLNIKNLAGSFYPAGLVYIPLEALETLPDREWKSGMAEIIKAAVLDSGEFLHLTKKLLGLQEFGRNSPSYRECLSECIARAIAFKGSIVEADPKETGNKRLLLNLGHTFGHALEAAAGFGVVSHGEAVAWGIARACELGIALGITPMERALEIKRLLVAASYEIAAPHPMVNSVDTLLNAIQGDKKQLAGNLRFIVPGETGVQIVSSEDSPLLKTSGKNGLLYKILNGEHQI